MHNCSSLILLRTLVAQWSKSTLSVHSASVKLTLLDFNPTQDRSWCEKICHLLDKAKGHWISLGTVISSTIPELVNLI